MNEKTESIGKALIAAIPYIGGSISSLLGDYQDRKKHERLTDFFTTLQADISEVKDQVNNKFISTDDFIDIFEETAQKIANERNEEIRSAYKNILLNSILSDSIDYDKVETYLKILERLRPGHILFLSIFYDPIKFDNDKGKPVGEGGGISTTLRSIMKQLLPDWEESAIIDIVSDLENERLISNFVNSLGTMMTDRGIHHMSGKLTEKGSEFCDFISK